MTPPHTIAEDPFPDTPPPVSETPLSGPAPAGSAPRRETWVEFLASNRLAIYTLSGLGIATLIGTIVPQRGPGLTEQQYADLIAKGGVFAVADKLGLYEVFHSPWFLALVLILCVNLIVCTITRIEHIVKPDYTKGIALGPKLLSRFGKQYHVPNAAPDDAAVRRLFRFRRRAEIDGDRYYYRETGRIKRYSVVIIHIAILIVCGAAIASKNLIIDGSMMIPTGEEADFVALRKAGGFRLPFAVRCDDFAVEFYEGIERPKTFRSVLTFLPEQGEPWTTPLLVNEPAKYGGFRFYQASYGPVGPRPKIRVTRRADAQVIWDRTMLLQKPYTMTDGSGGVFGVVSMLPDKDGQGPAAMILEAHADAPEQEFWIYKHQPEIEAARESTLTYEFVGAEMGGYYTGIMVSRNDAFPVLLFGCFLGFLGVLINFFLPHRRTILRVGPEGVVIAGSDSRGILMLEERLETLRDMVSAGKPD
ncbi:MAG: cytochrome c biogenesis protein ResB [Deltaproteobacteria bacterium]|nr:cytochrome c biogenesis protein ResB [Deltaproteobacteria bacterium]